MRVPKYIMALVVVFTLVGCDQETKAIAKGCLEYSACPAEYLGGLVQFQFAENAGGFLGLGSGLPASARMSIAIILVLLTSFGLVAFLLSAVKMKLPALISFSMLIAGALGNLIDRLLNQGRVVDFIILGTSTIHTGIFNMADASLLSGGLMLVLVELFQSRGIG